MVTRSSLWLRYHSRRKFVMFLLHPVGIALLLFRRHTILRVGLTQRWRYKTMSDEPDMDPT